MLAKTQNRQNAVCLKLGQIGENPAFSPGAGSGPGGPILPDFEVIAQHSSKRRLSVSGSLLANFFLNES